jgi:hypothetical protein
MPGLLNTFLIELSFLPFQNYLKNTARLIFLKPVSHKPIFRSRVGKAYVVSEMVR